MKTTITPPPAPVLIKDLGMMYPSETSKKKERYGLFKCSCGNEFKTQTSQIKNRRIKSCGCYNRQRSSEKNTKHGLWEHRLYHTWRRMIDRCCNDKNLDFKNYGARGITVCERWHDINNFIEDMDLSYQQGLSIDRINVNGNYEPSNCRWATKSIQSRNTRRIRSHNTSGYRGVSFMKDRCKWSAHIRVDGKLNHLGFFNDPKEAAKTYDEYVIAHKLEHTINGV